MAEKDIKYISSLVDILRSKGCNKNTIEEILYSLIPSNHNIKVEVGDFDKSAYFNITSETVKISYEKLKEFSPLIKEDFYNAISLDTCVNERNVYGGPSKAAIEKAVENAEKFLNN